MYFYRRKHGHYPRFGRKRGNISAPIIAPGTTARTRRRGVWRAQEPEEGLPGYTTEASGGELSLGVGRKRLNEAEEYELAVTLTTVRNSNEERTAREHSVATSHEGEETSSAVATKSTEALPPYIPPPTPAVVADGGGLGRVASRQSQHSGANRLAFPRAITTTSRRPSRVES